ncbi:MAG: AEC family transporter [Sumerlaeia bacterium]
MSLYLVSALGFVAVRRRWLGDEAISALTRLVIDIIVPATLMVGMLAGLDRSTLAEGGVVILIMLGTTLTGLLFGWLAGVLWPGGTPVSNRALAALCAFQNGIYLPLPLVLSLIPEEQHARGAVLVGCAVIVLSSIQWTLGVWLLRSDDQLAVARTAKWRDSVRGAFSPPVTGLLIGAVLAGIAPLAQAARDVPSAPLWAQIVVDTLQTIAQAMAPLAMMLLGMLIGRSELRRVLTLRSVAIPSLWRLIVAPALVYAAMELGPLGWIGSLVGLVLLVEAAAPPAVNLGVAARRYGGDWETTSSVMLPMYALSLLTIPVWVALALGR